MRLCKYNKLDCKFGVIFEPILKFKDVYEMNQQFTLREYKSMEGLRDLGFFRRESIPFMFWKGITKEHSHINNDCEETGTFELSTITNVRK